MVAAASACVAGLVSSSAGASTPLQPALDVPVAGSGGFNYTQGSYLEGFEFTARHPIEVVQLGAYDSNLSRLANGAETFAAVPVALYDMTTGARLALVTVRGSSPARGVYRYVALSAPVRLNTHDRYSVAWVSLTNHYVASPHLKKSAINSAIRYLAMVGNGAGGLTQVRTMVRPNWFFTYAAHGLSALNYDLGPNLLFRATS